MQETSQDPNLSEDGSTVNGFETITIQSGSHLTVPESVLDSSYGPDTNSKHDGSVVPDLDSLNLRDLPEDDQFSISSQGEDANSRLADQSQVTNVERNAWSQLLESKKSNDTAQPLDSSSDTPIMPLRRTGTAATHASTMNRPFLSEAVTLDDVSYLLKSVQYNGSEKIIVCQTTNGACPILSIANFLSLNSLIDLPKRQPQITARALSDTLADFLISHERDLSALDYVEGLHRGLNINPRFTGVQDFEAGPAPIQAFGAELVHGWIPAPSSAVHELLTRTPDPSGTRADGVLKPVLTNFEAAQIQLLLKPESIDSLQIEAFFTEFPNNMTPTGLARLREHLIEGEMRILFYNAHFSLLYKHPESGDLYTLVTDAGYIESGDNVVWESLVLDAPTQYFSADFIPRNVLGESLQDNDYGHQPSSSQHDCEDDAALARRLQNEEAGAEQQSDEMIARRLQEQENQRAARSQEERQRQRAEDQNRMDRYNGARERRNRDDAMPAQTSRPPIPARRSSGVDASKKEEKEDKCVIM